MVKTLEDVKRVAGIADQLREFGIPEKICIAIDRWNKKQEEKLNNGTTLVSLCDERKV